MALGGRRRKQPLNASPNDFWQNVSFRNYADYAMTDAFRDYLADPAAHETEPPPIG